MEEELVYIQLATGELELGKPQFAGSCFGYNIEPREKYAPLIVPYVEDDGMWFRKNSFDSSWLTEQIEQLTKVKEYLNVG